MMMMMIFELRSLAMLLEVEFYCHTNITQAVSSGNSNQAPQQQHKSQSPSSVCCFLPTSNTSAAIATTTTAAAAAFYASPATRFSWHWQRTENRKLTE